MRSWLTEPDEATPKPIARASSPLLRSLGRRLYWGARGLYARRAGTALFERHWSRRGAAEIRTDFSNLHHHHRQWLLERFDPLHPFTSALEVGCGYGANVQLLASRFCDAEVVGIDINPTSVLEGNALLAELGIQHARLLEGKADDLSQFADQQFDVVLTDATLLYIGPDKIEAVIREMRRVSRRALLFVELHRPESRRDRKGLGVFTPDGWVRDYRRLLERFFPDNSITLTKIPQDVWPEGRWGELGHLISVTLGTE